MKFSTKYIYTLSILLLAYCTTISSQSNTAVGIEKKLKISKDFLQKDLDSALYYAKESLRLSRDINNDSLIGKSLLHISSTLIWQRNYVAADSIIRSNLTKNLLPETEGMMRHNLGVIQHNQQNYEEALVLYFKAVEVLEKAKNTNKIANTYTNIGILSTTLGYFENGQKYLKKALALCDDNNILKIQATVNLANLFYRQELYDKFLETSFEVEKLCIQQNAKSLQTVIYNNLSNYYTHKAMDYDKGLLYAKKSVRLKKELGFTSKLGQTYKIIGESYFKKKEYQKAILYLDSALQKSNRVHKPGVYEYLNLAYAKLGDHKTALHYADLRSKMKDSITNEKQEEKVAELIEKYESQKKGLEINNLLKEKKNQQQIVMQAKSLKNLYLFLTIVLFILFVGSIWAFRRLKKQQTELARLNQFKSRLFSIIAHDLRGLIIPFQRSGKIMKYHIDKENYQRTIELSMELEKSSHLLANTLDNLLHWSLAQMNGYKIDAKDMFFGREIKEIIANYQQQADFKNTNIHLEYEKDIAVRFDKGIFHVIFRNLLGNALKYTENGAINIKFFIKADRLECIVIDDGVGMSVKQVKDVFNVENKQTTIGTKGEKGTGIGLNLVSRFVDLHKGTIKVFSEKAKGTRFELSFPIE
ncbi:tetratricopeptide repeat protein [Aquimarina addita]|uniref:histidine kinase n=1 Tax=Aquimarina addita TaxID=870485 RepID=A0ABP6UNN9_9FLAO